MPGRMLLTGIRIGRRYLRVGRQQRIHRSPSATNELATNHADIALLQWCITKEHLVFSLLPSLYRETQRQTNNSHEHRISKP